MVSSLRSSWPGRVLRMRNKQIPRELHRFFCRKSRNTSSRPLEFSKDTPHFSIEFLDFEKEKNHFPSQEHLSFLKSVGDKKELNCTI